MKVEKTGNVCEVKRATLLTNQSVSKRLQLRSTTDAERSTKATTGERLRPREQPRERYTIKGELQPPSALIDIIASVHDSGSTV